MNVHMSRRGFIFGAAAFSIVRPEILMPIKQITPTLVLVDTSASLSAREMWNLVTDMRINDLIAQSQFNIAGLTVVDEFGQKYTGE